MAISGHCKGPDTDRAAHCSMCVLGCVSGCSMTVTDLEERVVCATLLFSRKLSLYYVNKESNWSQTLIMLFTSI